MDLALLAIVIIAAGIGFYAALRAYSRRQLRQGHRPADED
jgi:hypothetical protein